MGMKIACLNDMIGGWFVGGFEPSIFKTNDFEVAVKEYKRGAKEEWHVHKVALEITLVLNGTAIMCGKEISHGEIILLEAGEATSFEAITDLTTVVVKAPSILGDKYFKDEL